MAGATTARPRAHLTARSGIGTKLHGNACWPTETRVPFISCPNQITCSTVVRPGRGSTFGPNFRFPLAKRSKNSSFPRPGSLLWQLAAGNKEQISKAGRSDLQMRPFLRAGKCASRGHHRQTELGYWAKFREPLHHASAPTRLGGRKDTRSRASGRQTQPPALYCTVWTTVFKQEKTIVEAYSWMGSAKPLDAPKPLLPVGGREA